MNDWRVWLHGLVAATITGAASGIGAVVGSLAIGTGLKHALEIALASAVLSGIVGAAAYLKQSPVPPEWDGVDRRKP